MRTLSLPCEISDYLLIQKQNIGSILISWLVSLPFTSLLSWKRAEFKGLGAAVGPLESTSRM